MNTENKSEIKIEQKEEKKPNAVKVKPKQPKKKEEKFIYIGPNIPGVLTKNTAYTGELSKEIKAVIERQPAIKNLLVTPREYTKARNELNSGEGALSLYYKKAGGTE